MKRVIFTFLLSFLLIMPVYAQRGCCSHHGGVYGCASNGRQVCNDGTYSPTCTCTPPKIYGCTDKKAKNYNKNANKNNGSCVYYVYGCTDKKAKNYNKKAEKDDGSCVYYVYGCTDKKAKNYNKKAEKDDGSCISYIYGCTDEDASNYNPKANTNDDSCIYDEHEQDNSESNTTDNIVKNNANTSNDKDTSNGELSIISMFFMMSICGCGIYFLFKKLNL